MLSFHSQPAWAMQLNPIHHTENLEAGQNEDSETDHTCCENNQHQTENDCGDQACHCDMICCGTSLVDAAPNSFLRAFSFRKKDFSYALLIPQSPLFAIWTPPDIR